VRRQFSGRLASNLRKLLRRERIEGAVDAGWDMLELNVADDQQCAAVVDLLQRIPGVAHFLEVREFALELDDPGILDLVARHTASAVGEQLAGKTFVVRCKRVGRHIFTSQEVERQVGGYLLHNTAALGVSLREPELTVALEVKADRLFVVQHRYPGLGGFPTGCLSPVLSLVSGGFDSSVASFDVIRRGMEVHFCFFNLGGRAHEVGVKQVCHYIWDRYAASHRVAFVSVPFERVVEEILARVDNAYMGVVLKRMMYRAATQIADAMEIDALVTGESVAQVSSQTLRNLSVIDAATSKLVLRPLSTWDKSHIIRRANDIGVAQFAEHMPEYCAVISNKPTTAAKLEKVIEQEQRFDFSLLDDAVGIREMHAIDSVYKTRQHIEDVEVQHVPKPHQVVIDLRSADEQERMPLVLHGNETVAIPFFRINACFGDLDSSREYLLYCDRGVMSRLHAMHLRAEGFRNVRVYQPIGE
jgi:thiamine biosynthesis protein ThiI